MYNTFQYNSAQYNGIKSNNYFILLDPDDDSYIPTLEPWDIYFAGKKIGRCGEDVIVSEVDFLNPPTKEINRFFNPQWHGGKFINSKYEERTINMKGLLIVDSHELMQSAVDNLNKIVSKDEGWLDWYLWGKRRRLKGTMSIPNKTYEKQEHYNIYHINYELEFTSVSPFSNSINDNSVGFSNITSDLSFQYKNEGNAESKLTTIIIVNQAGTETLIRLENKTTNELIEFDITPSNGDIITINGEDSTVKLNGQNIQYRGFFPASDPSRGGYGNNLTLQNNGSGYNYSATIKSKINWL